MGQIKNIKLHIVTDIKVSINTLHQGQSPHLPHNGSKENGSVHLRQEHHLVYSFTVRTESLRWSDHQWTGQYLEKIPCQGLDCPSTIVLSKLGSQLYQH